MASCCTSSTAWNLQRQVPRFSAGFRVPPAYLLASRGRAAPERLYSKRPAPANGRVHAGDGGNKGNGKGEDGQKTSKGSLSIALAGALSMAGVAGFYTVELFGFAYGNVTNHECGSDPCTAPTGRPTTLSGLSPLEFDRRLDLEEETTGITKMRRELAQRATGHVLEVAVGTGRNFGLYDVGKLRGHPCAGSTSVVGGLDSFTGVDVSSDMLDVAASKVPKVLPSLASASPSITVLRGPKSDVVGGGVEYMDGRIRLVRSNALHSLPPPPPSVTTDGATKYDTVIQTFGLCSVSDPKRLVANLVEAAKPGTGTVILLEHGTGTWRLVNMWLDWLAPGHFQKYGCWWNRNIESIVRETVRDLPGVEVAKLERPSGQLGTVLLIELRVGNVEGKA